MCYKAAYHSKWKSHPKAWHHDKMKRKAWRRARRFGYGWSYPPVNVQELDDRYELYLYAPGLEKEDFKLSLTDNILTVSTEPKETEMEESARWKKREFVQRSFERHFELNDKIDKESISAAYKEGVLQITLKKLEGFETNRQDIVIA